MIESLPDYTAQLVITILAAFGLFTAIANRLKISSKSVITSLFTREPKQFKYKKLELGLRVKENGLVWSTIRKATIVSLKRSLEVIEFGVKPENIENKPTYSALPKDIEIELSDSNGGTLTEPAHDSTQFTLRLSKPLKKFQESEFTFYYDFRKSRQKKNEKFFWSSMSDVDELVLSVIFFDEQPKRVSKQQLSNLRTRILKQEELRPDDLTLAYKWKIKRPKKDRTYSITWTKENNRKMGNS